MRAITNPHMLSGLQIVTSVYLTKPLKTGRTWRERLFSWPWRPWQEFRIINVPDRQFYIVGKTVHCHPAMLAELQRVIDLEDKL